MKKIVAALAVVLMSMVFTGCTATRIYMSENWKEAPKKVKVVFTEPQIDRMDDLRDDLPEYADNFSEWYKIQLASNLKKASKVPNYVIEPISRNDVAFDDFRMRRSSVSVPRPANMTDDADIYVIVDDIWLGRTSETRTNTSQNAQGIMITTESTMHYFTTKGSYAYYDAKTKECLGFDTFERRVAYSFVVSKSDWENLLTQTVERIVEKTPLQ